MNTDKSLRNLSLLMARAVLGGTMAAHGAQKMFGAFDGSGLKGTTGMMESFGFTPGEPYARALAATELGSGALIALGAFGPVGPAMLLAVMYSAVELVHKPKGYFNTEGGFEMNAMFVVIAMLLATEGYGAYSFDGLFGLHERLGPTIGWAALLGGLGGALAMLSQRKPPSDAQAPHSHSSNTQTGEIESPVGAS
jgi:putative oxidoreductase